MKITKHQTKELTYYECEPIKGYHLFAFSFIALLRDLFIVYKLTMFNPKTIKN